MFRLVLAEQQITNPTAAAAALGKYNGSDLELGLNGSMHPITFLRASATGDKANDELNMEFVWRYDDASKFGRVYNQLRSSINNVVRFKVGREEFTAVLADTTKIQAGANAEDALKHKFIVVASHVQPVGVTAAAQPITAKAHSSSIVEILVPDPIWNHIKQHVPGAKDLEDPPHITLCYMNLKEGQLEEVQTALSELSASWGPFQINVTGAGSFPSDKSEVPHFACIESSDLVKFREDAVACIQAIDPDLIDNTFPNFTPHLTVQFVGKDEPLPVIKPISWQAKECSLSFKGTKKYLYPLSFTTDRQGLPPSVEPGKEIKASIMDDKAISELAGNISDRLAALGYREEAETVERAAEAVLAKKKKKKIDKSVEKFVDKLRKELGVFVEPHKLDHCTSTVLNLLTDDNHSVGTQDQPDVDGIDVGDSPAPDAGGDSGGAVAGSAPKGISTEVPLTDGFDAHTAPGRRRSKPSIVTPNGAPQGTKALPFMERNYSTSTAQKIRDLIKEKPQS